MIKSPEIPTDNLYKFIAIFGLTIFISSIYFFITTQQTFYLQLEERNKKHSEYLLRDAKNNTKKVSLENSLRIKELFIESKYQFSPSSINNKNALQHFKGNAELMFHLNEYNNLQLSINELNDEINSEKNKNDDEFEKDISNNYINSIGILGAIGLAMIFFGFKFWYSKTQKFVDLHLKEINIKKTD